MTGHRHRVAITAVVGLLLATSATLRGQERRLTITPADGGTRIALGNVQVTSKVAVKSSVETAGGKSIVVMDPPSPIKATAGTASLNVQEDVEKIEFRGDGV